MPLFERQRHGGEGPIMQSMKLDPKEAGAFLGYVFADVARKPEPLSFRDGVAAVRLLQGLAALPSARGHGVFLTRSAMMLWRILLPSASERVASPEKAVAFLEKHADTYLANAIDAGRLVRLIREGPRVKSSKQRPPLLMSQKRSVSGHGNPRLLDDLSERIFGAYWALRLSRIHGARRRIANPLNERELRSAKLGPAPWGPDEVAERIKQYEKRLRAKPDADRRPQLARRREGAAESWIGLFRADTAANALTDQEMASGRGCPSRS